MKKAKSKKQKEHCRFYETFDNSITCCNPKLIKCICTGVCKDYEPQIKPFIEK